ncbi:MAG TPA: MgtC/SapB family protein [Usitatibacter sp.]|nr:MgtC/SapB family protein [Usitatibacter sp.]
MPPTVDLDATSLAIRLGAALLAGGLIGVDREMNRKPAGMRTHALVSIGSAIVVLIILGSARDNGDALSRAVQGIITGIGFLGAGVILQLEAERRIEGLTTAATIWVAAALGMACGAGQVELVAIAVVVVLVVLGGGNYVEDAIKRRLSPGPRIESPPEARDSDRK